VAAATILCHIAGIVVAEVMIESLFLSGSCRK
jgi:hypothetical protein